MLVPAKIAPALSLTTMGGAARAAGAQEPDLPATSLAVMAMIPVVSAFATLNLPLATTVPTIEA